MKKYSYIWISFIVLIFGILFFPKIMDRIDSDSINNDTRLSNSKELSFIKINNEKKKVPNFVFLNQDSLFIGNEDFLSKVFVVEFFFTSCPSICIEMNKNMKILDEEFGEREDFGIASFTIDPSHDTTKVLKEYSELLQIKSKNWHFLTGDVSDIYDLSNTGFNIFSSINPDVAGGFEHQGFFALIDQNGYIRSRDNGMGSPIVYYLGINDENSDKQGIDMLKEDILKLLKV
ncbi:MAG: SCO family protein [Flavobacteriaceae bacterium]|nr:SCO family protein [Flavobacteriaceae bacterium]|tara:strand:+ start:7609 stop:8304 length:696 start_codon:yes stop_codon:yes gene_type:complete